MTCIDTRRWQVAQTVSHVMLDHMSSSGVMRGDSRRHRERMMKHEVKNNDIAAVHVQYHNMSMALDVPPQHGLDSPQLFHKKNGFLAFFSAKKACL